MKTLINITLVASLSALSALTAQASVITTHSLTDGYAWDSDTWNSVGDGFNDNSGNTGWDSEYIGSVGGAKQLRRAFFDTTLPTTDGTNPLTSGDDIQTATLKVWYDGTSVAGDGLSIFYDTVNAGRTGADMFSTAWTDTGFGIANNAANGYYEFDVTTLVQASYDDGANNIASFRFQVDNDTTTFTQGTAEVFRVNGSASTDPLKASVLILETIPEPATLGLIAVFGGGIIFIRRRLMI